MLARGFRAAQQRRARFRALGPVLVLAFACGRFGYDPLREAANDAPAQGLARPVDGGAPTGPGACRIGFANCDGDLENGCETQTATSVSTCGACGVGCQNGHGAAACVAGICVPTCVPGFGDCDGDPSNGCEQALDVVGHCGACGAVCADTHALAACVDARCSPACSSGFRDCDGNPNNGCEADLENDPMNCGGCAGVCGSDEICSSGRCVPSPCAAGLGDCDGDPSACEASVESSTAHCGFCNNACAAASGTPACVAGECRVQACDGGFGDCDGVQANGCEVPLATTAQHCGSCATACTNAHGTTSCNGSSCAPTCSSGFGDCDGSRQNGCETALDSVSHCGACGNACPANGGTPVCNSGVCGTTCDLDGTFALALSAPCSWPASQYRRAGNGTLVYWFKADLDQTGTSVAATVLECGRIKPPLVNTVDETVQQGFPNTLYDNDFLPSSSAVLTLGASSPGSSFSWPLTAHLMGISMDDPKADGWPTSASQVPAARRIDMDRDGKVGMTGTYDGGDYPRTSTSFSFNRADQFYFAARTSYSLSGSLMSCSASSGSATLSRADIRILGCNRANSTQDCSASESDLLDTTAAPLTIGAGSYTLARIANGAGCAAVRAALPQP
jgi:hypothetical protein